MKWPKLKKTTKIDKIMGRVFLFALSTSAILIALRNLLEAMTWFAGVVAGSYLFLYYTLRFATEQETGGEGD